jgi:penicillin-binding protein 1A
MDRILGDVVAGGTGSRASRVANARGKTGTTSSYRDAWFVGYTDKFMGVGWMGNEVAVKDKNGSHWIYPPMTRVFGGTYVAPMWAGIVAQAQKILGEERRTLQHGAGAITTEPEIDDPTMDDPLGDAAPIPDGATVPPLDAPQDTPTEEPPTTRRDPVAPRVTNGDEYVYVEVCADSGQRSTIYCPERVKRPFKRGSEPKRTCHLHKPPGI